MCKLLIVSSSLVGRGERQVTLHALLSEHAVIERLSVDSSFRPYTGISVILPYHYLCRANDPSILILGSYPRTLRGKWREIVYFEVQ